MTGVLQAVLVVAVSPLLLGLGRQVRARLEGRVGPGVGQPWRDLRKLAGKELLRPRGTGEPFRYAPAVLFASTLLVAAVVPLAAVGSAVPAMADLFAVVAILAAGTTVLALAGLDTGSAFGGMGASRETTILALAEPTLLLAIFALSVRVGSTNLVDVVGAGPLASPVGLLAAVALLVVIIAETGRLPVDNPATHLELTMVHEAMVLEYAGPDLALVELAAAMRTTVLLGLFVNLFLPWGIATTVTPVALGVGVVALLVKIAALVVLLGAAEVFLAKLRLFRVPELLAGSFLLALLAVGAAFFLGTGAT